MSKKYTVKDWLDCKVAITFDSRKEFKRFVEMVKPYEIKWRSGRKPFGDDGYYIFEEIVLGFLRGEERIASRGADKRYTCINFKDLDLPNTQEIHITTDGIKNVYGVLQENGKVVKKTMAKCHPSDTFDFEIGVATVMDRLLEKEDVSKTIKVGDKVKVIDDRECFPHYGIWFRKNDCRYLESHFVEGGLPLNNYKYQVVAIGKHHRYDFYGAIYAIQDLTTTQVFIIDGKGIEKV